MTTLQEKMNIIRDSRFIDDKYHKYTNMVQLNGYLLSQPRHTILKNGKEIVTFYLLQLHLGTFVYYPCQTFAKGVIGKLDKVKKCSLVNVLGRLVYSKNSRYSFQVEEILVSHEFPELDIEPPYERENKDEIN